jgi:hypothetical protein
VPSWNRAVHPLYCLLFSKCIKLARPSPCPSLSVRRFHLLDRRILLKLVLLLRSTRKLAYRPDVLLLFHHI